MREESKWIASLIPLVFLALSAHWRAWPRTATNGNGSCAMRRQAYPLRREADPPPGLRSQSAADRKESRRNALPLNGLDLDGWDPINISNTTFIITIGHPPGQVMASLCGCQLPNPFPLSNQDALSHQRDGRVSMSLTSPATACARAMPPLTRCWPARSVETFIAKPAWLGDISLLQPLQSKT